MAAEQEPKGLDAAIVRSAAQFLREFVRFAGWSGLRAVVAVAVAALLENVGIVLLIPFLSLAMEGTAPSGATAALAARCSARCRPRRASSKIGLLLALFAALLVLRAMANGVQIRI